MGALSSVIPGLREIRPTLAGGYLWLLFAYLALAPIGDQLSAAGEDFGLADDVGRLLNEIGDLGRAIAVSVLAYAIGIMVEETRTSRRSTNWTVLQQLPRLLTVADSINRVVNEESTEQPSLSEGERALDDFVRNQIELGRWTESDTMPIAALVERLETLGTAKGDPGRAESRIVRLVVGLWQRVGASNEERAKIEVTSGLLSTVHASVVHGPVNPRVALSVKIPMRTLNHWRSRQDSSPLDGEAGLRRRVQRLELAAGRLAETNPAIQSAIVRRFAEERTRQAVSVPGLLILLVIGYRTGDYLVAVFRRSEEAEVGMAAAFGLLYAVPVFLVASLLWWRATRGRDILAELSSAEQLIEIETPES